MPSRRRTRKTVKTTASPMAMNEEIFEPTPTEPEMGADTSMDEVTVSLEASTDNPVEASEVSDAQTPLPEPEPVPLNRNAQYQADSIVKEYRRRFNHDLVIIPVDKTAFQLSATRKSAATEGEMEFLLKWFSWRWTGDIEVGDNTFTLRVVGPGDFHPSGGVSPRLVGRS